MLQLENPLKEAKLYRYPYGDITQLFGENPELYKTHTKLLINGHNGWDIAKPYGTPVLAPCYGYIADIKDSPDGYGRHIRLITQRQEDSYYYEITFGHLAEIKTKLGYWVKSGDVIGLCGNSGFIISGGVSYWNNYNPDNRGTHLHITIRKLSDLQTGYNSAFLKYPNDKYGYNVENYDNGFAGAVNPVFFFENIIQKQAISIIEMAKRIINEVINWLKGRDS